MGGQLLFWEQSDHWLVDDLQVRLPAMAERLWNPDAGTYAEYEARTNAMENHVMTLVRPVQIRPLSADPTHPVNLMYRLVEGSSIDVEMVNRTKVAGTIRYETANISGNFDNYRGANVPPVTSGSSVYTGTLPFSGRIGLRAQLFRQDGTRVGGSDWAVYNNWEDRVRTTEYRIGRDEFPRDTVVPDTENIDQTRLIRTYDLPGIRPPLAAGGRVLQRHDGTLQIEEGGSYTILAESQHGNTTVYLDLDNNGVWDSGEDIIVGTPSSEEVLTSTHNLSAGSYRFRVDHLMSLPRNYISIRLQGPDTGNQPIRVRNHMLPLR